MDDSPKLKIDKTIPIVPLMDMWLECPTCGHDPEFVDCGGFRLHSDSQHYPVVVWEGPSFCPNCGQALDLSPLND